MERNTFQTRELADILGMSRDTLRYFEEQNIVQPNHNEQNNYRQYDNYDIYTLMVADFYKKRNLTLKEVRKLQAGSEISELESLLETKAVQVEDNIQQQHSLLQLIRETKAFCGTLHEHLNRYSIQKFPAYKILGEFSGFQSFSEYPRILEKIDIRTEDILSSILRRFTFDKNGLLDSNMLIVQKQKSGEEDRSNDMIQYSNCIYTIAEDGRTQDGNHNLEEPIFHASLKWGKAQGYSPAGVAFVKTRLVTYSDHQERVFLEIFIPVEKG
ncbi:MerR family transcriptional regulator ['Paenibacillus yunnanensis' Narsing Rao et al. 2020]|uniref:MerR family transcriptional regulator n=1 Tax=Paenibacillus tengchongensis TaxID=2608684 RepID=UPI00124C9B87|nr:MerR family transcriptional regulator [Paenibacillus tengchongensis]